MTEPAPQTITKDACLDAVARAGAPLAGDLADESRLRTFLQHYFRHVDEDELCPRPTTEIIGQVASHAGLAAVRLPGQSQLRVWQPDGSNGYTAGGRVVIEVVTDDRPFIVDSVTMEVTRQGWRIVEMVHPQFRVFRDTAGRMTDIVSRSHPDAGQAVAESWLYLEVTAPLGQSAAALLPELEQGIARVLDQVAEVVEDWKPMLARADAAAAEMETYADDDHRVAAELLRWFMDDHFTFLGYREYTVAGRDFSAVPGTGLGLLRDGHEVSTFDAYPTDAFVDVMTYTKDSVKSPVHRPAYLDYLGVRTFDAQGRI